MTTAQHPSKWFYPVQEKVKQYLDSYFDTYSCGWQDVVNKEGIVYEQYSGISKANTHEALLITITKQTNDFFVYKMISR